MRVDFSSNQQRMYGDLAWTWPIISPPEEYEGEAERFRQMIQARSQIEVRTLLDLGCGGGHIDHTLKQYYRVTGVDMSQSMLSLARELNPKADYALGDMRSVRLGKRFDAVIIADSIDYMLTEEDLRAAFVTAFEHLRAGGVFCTYAECTLERFQQNTTLCSTHSRGEVDIAFMHNNYDPDPADTLYESTFVYLIRRQGQLSIETDRHLGGLFKLESWLELLQDVGFEVELTEDEGIPHFACLKPLEGA